MMYNHRNEAGATRSVVVNGAQNQHVGLAKSLRVVPGDIVDMEVFAKYYIQQSEESIGTSIAEAVTNAFRLSSNSIGPEYSAFQSLSSIFNKGWILTENDWQDLNAPKAFLNNILFDEEFIPYDMSWDQIGIDAHPTQQDRVDEIGIDENRQEYLELVEEKTILQELRAENTQRTRALDETEKMIDSLHGETLHAQDATRRSSDSQYSQKFLDWYYRKPKTNDND